MRRNAIRCICIIFKFNLLRKGEWKGANQCQLYLEVPLVSNISTGVGCYITQQSWDGEQGNETAMDIEWSQQGKPDNTDGVS